MPPKTPYPTPVLRLHNGAWKVVWSYSGRQYSVSTGLPENDKLFAEQRRIEFAIALKQDTPAFPEKYAAAKGVVKYIEARYGLEAVAKAAKALSPDWLTDYEPEIKSECSKKWAESSVVALKAFDKEVGGISKATPDMVTAYLAMIAEKQKPATRNRVLHMITRFYKWAVLTERAKTNPAAGIKRITEERGSDIIHCTPEEREEIISIARESGWMDWLAIPLAFYAGMRREEISRLLWKDVRFKEGLIVVQKSKTGKSRTLPLASALEKILLEVPENERVSTVVITPPDLNRAHRLDNLVHHIQHTKRERVLKVWNLEKPAPSRAKDYHEKLNAWKDAMKDRDTELDAVLERIGWNPFRHTFGSLLAQGGVSIDKISSWMGNTPDVCRRHYAQFIPRARRDDEIDKL